MTSLETLATVAAALAAIGLMRLVRTMLFVRGAERTRATVVARVDVSVDDHGTSSASTERWTVELVHQGRARRLPLAEAFGGAIVERLIDDDDSIPVLFDPRKPDRVRIDSPWTLHFLSVFLCAPAILLLALIGYVAVAR